MWKKLELSWKMSQPRCYISISPSPGAPSHITSIGTGCLASACQGNLSWTVCLQAPFKSDLLSFFLVFLTKHFFIVAAASGPATRRVINPCHVNPCWNGGVCSLMPHSPSFACSCPERFTGRLCELSTYHSHAPFSSERQV